VNEKEVDMDELRGHNRLKATGVLLLFAVFLGALLVVPSLRRAPVIDAPTEQPGNVR
jgi:hypothetical protein